MLVPCLLAALTAFLGGILQGVTGFGVGVVQMILLPIILPLTEAAAVSAMIAFFLSLSIFLRYRRHIHVHKILLPAVVYLTGSYFAIQLAVYVDQALLQRFLGVFLLLLALYYLFLHKQGSTEIHLGKTILFSLFSGVCSGLFGIGGPLMAVLFLSISDSKEEFHGNIQGLFTITTLTNSLIRLHKQILSPAHLPFILLGVIAVLLGGLVAKHIVDRINKERLNRITYAFVGVSGLLNLFGL